MRSKSFITLMPGYIFNILFYSDESVAYAGFLNTTSTMPSSSIFSSLFLETKNPTQLLLFLRSSNADC